MKSFFAVLLIVISMSTAYGLKCYVCDSHDSDLVDSDCGDTFELEDNADKLMDCNSTATHCLKRKRGVNHLWTHIERGCADMCEDDNVAYVDRTDCCTADGCNTGTNVLPAVTLVAGAVCGLMGLRRLL